MEEKIFQVEKYGEVYTEAKEVNRMIDEINFESTRLESTFLEPACGDGNFLLEILFRKIKTVELRYKKIELDFQFNIFLSIASLYGIDIQEKNVKECRERLYKCVKSNYENHLDKIMSKEFINAINFVLSKNIQPGDALNLINPVTKNPIIFSKWSVFPKYKIKRTDYTFKSVLNYESIQSLPLFSDLGEPAFIPEPINENNPVFFMDIA